MRRLAFSRSQESFKGPSVYSCYHYPHQPLRPSRQQQTALHLLPLASSSGMVSSLHILSPHLSIQLTTLFLFLICIFSPAPKRKRRRIPRRRRPRARRRLARRYARRERRHGTPPRRRALRKGETSLPIRIATGILSRFRLARGGHVGSEWECEELRGCRGARVER